MNPRDSIEPVTVLRRRGPELLRRAKESGQLVIITQNGKPSGVLQDIESHQRQQDAFLLLTFLAKGDQQIREGKGVSHAQAMTHFERTLASEPERTKFGRPKLTSNPSDRCQSSENEDSGQ